ncbi:IS66 family insertion sequence element accessory protein TnpB [Pseudomonas chlororaphis subsp. aurantiaca]
MFANRCANRVKMLVHDVVGIWLAVRCLSQECFLWPSGRHGPEVELGAE